MPDFSNDSQETLEFKSTVVLRAILISTFFEATRLVPAGEETAMALRLLAKIAETNAEVSPEALAQELDFLIADMALRK